jgi:hypothetical protein
LSGLRPRILEWRRSSVVPRVPGLASMRCRHLPSAINLLQNLPHLDYCSGGLETVGVVALVVKRITPVLSEKNRRCPVVPWTLGVASTL